MALTLLIALIIAGDAGSKQQVREQKLIKELQQLKEENQKLNNHGKVKSVQQSNRPNPRVQVLSFVGSKREIASYILTKFGSQGQTALAIANCESHLNPLAVGSHGERGVMQIHPVHQYSMTKIGFTWNQMFDWKKNIDYAYVLYKYNGWFPWSCRSVIASL